MLETMANGKVYLVGAGPGDPGLLTLRAVEILQRADAVLYDYLVNPAILRHCRPGAIKISVGRHGSSRVIGQEEINKRLLALVESHETVVRLKSGDPMIFARASSEIGCLVESGIAFEVVPGISAALAAPAYGGIPITDRDTASAVAFITGQESPGSADAPLNYAALASFPGTLVFYMGVTTVEHWSQALLDAGRSPRTPIAILRRVSWPDQQRIDTELGHVAAIVANRRLRPPVLFIVGEVASRGGDWSWFENRPLFGQRVLVTRPLHQADDLARPLAELGADVLVQPAIEIQPIDDLNIIDRALERLDRFDWLVFSSSNGVRHFLERLPAIGRDVRALSHLRIAAIGPGTAEELARFHLRADLVPEQYRAESLAAALAGLVAGRRVLLVRASRGRELLAEELTKAGGLVEQIVAYHSVDMPAPDAEVAARMTAGEIHWTTVTSSAIARSLVRLFGESLQQTKLASISPITSATLHELGLEPAAEAAEYTMTGLVAAIQAAVIAPVNAPRKKNV
jgi:uroporphyrinogen III methyltransferase/synthase